jgi:His-Xaa-Ser system radical SAM maturase HxsC
MCSQPPRDVDDGWILDEIADCIELIDPATETIGFTGGEPLLEWPRLVALLAALRDRLPDTAVHVLTNGRAFSSDEVASDWAAVGHSRLSAGIPLYSAVDHLHDYVVQARGAFDDTVLGILRLKDKGQRVEVRVVLHTVTAPRLRETCGWLARNLPFVDHVALMGLENTGFVLANQALLWIDPLDYQADLACGVDMLRAAGGERLDLQPTAVLAGPLGVGCRGAVDLRLEKWLLAGMRWLCGTISLCRVLFDGQAAEKSRDPTRSK